MSRPEHLSCPNTVIGIQRINREQKRYDRDPQAYEAEERAAKERYEEEQQAEREHYEQQQNY